MTWFKRVALLACVAPILAASGPLIEPADHRLRVFLRFRIFRRLGLARTARRETSTR